MQTQQRNQWLKKESSYDTQRAYPRAGAQAISCSFSDKE
jgi:hypothetical protein